MNVAYNSALRQSKAVRAQLSTMPTSPPPTAADIGTAAASLATLAKAIDEYARHAHQLEPSDKKRAEADARLKRFRDDLGEFRASLETSRRARDDAQLASDRSELLGNRRPYAASSGGTNTPENPYANAAASSSSTSSGRHHASNPYGNYGRGTASLGFGTADDAREAHALREQNFFAGTHSALDDYIARGQAVLGNLGEQREMLKGTQRRLYSVANTLGVSGDTIRMVERRAREDKWIFGAGVLVFFIFCWLCLRYLR
jgi:hypothetical protein